MKYKKISVKQLVQRPYIVMRHEGMLVTKKRFTNDGKLLDTGEKDSSGKKLSGFHWSHVREDGKIVDKKDVYFFNVKDEGEEEVSQFKRTAEIKVIKEVPLANVDNYLITSHYELFHVEESSISALYEEAERYFKEDLAGICLFSWGNGFIQYYGILAPIMKDGQFVWILRLTETEIIYSHLMDVPTQKTPIEQPPTLELPMMV